MRTSSIAGQTFSQQPDMSEIILSCSREDPFTLVLPMLAHLSHQCENRWFTWVTQSTLDFTQLEKYAFARSNVRMVRVSNDQEAQKILQESLTNGTSATVVAELVQLSNSERNSLENAGAYGNTNSIILRLNKQRYH